MQLCIGRKLNNKEVIIFIVLLKYIQPMSVIEENLSEHREFLNKYYLSNNFILSGPQVPRDGGVILVKGMARSELDHVITEDPFYRNKVASYQVIEFTPTGFGAGLEELIVNS